MPIKDFRHMVRIQPRFADIDMMGHLNNATYHTYLEEARLAYARTVLQGGDKSEVSGMILAKTTIDYLKPIYRGDTILVYTRCTRLGRKSFDLACLILRESDQELMSTGLTTLVTYDYAAERSELIPEIWRERVLAYEACVPTEA